MPPRPLRPPAPVPPAPRAPPPPPPASPHAPRRPPALARWPPPAQPPPAPWPPRPPTSPPPWPPPLQRPRRRSSPSLPRSSPRPRRASPPEPPARPPTPLPAPRMTLPALPLPLLAPRAAPRSLAAPAPAPPAAARAPATPAALPRLRAQPAAGQPPLAPPQAQPTRSRSRPPRRRTGGGSLQAPCATAPSPPPRAPLRSPPACVARLPARARGSLRRGVLAPALQQHTAARQTGKRPRRPRRRRSALCPGARGRPAAPSCARTSCTGPRASPSPHGPTVGSGRGLVHRAPRGAAAGRGAASHRKSRRTRSCREPHDSVGPAAWSGPHAAAQASALHTAPRPASSCGAPVCGCRSLPPPASGPASRGVCGPRPRVGRLRLLAFASLGASGQGRELHAHAGRSFAPLNRV